MYYARFFLLTANLMNQGGETMQKMQNFNYDVIEHCGTISQMGNQTKELNVISYNDAPAKYDLRIWFERDQKGKQMGKGFTMNEEEIYTLREILNALDLEQPIPQGKGFSAGDFSIRPF